MEGILRLAQEGRSSINAPDSLAQLRRVMEAQRGGPAPQPLLAALSQMAVGEDILKLCFNFAQDADAEVFYQIVGHTHHPLDLEMNDAAFSPPSARIVLAALEVAGDRLHKVHLRGSWLGRSALKTLLQAGLECAQLDLSGCRCLRGKLAFQGAFPRLRTLVLDSNPSIQNLTEASFSALPQLTSLSLCGSALANLWTTCAALSQLTTLRQLCLQRCACCVTGTAACTGRRSSGSVYPSISVSRTHGQPSRLVPLMWAEALADEDSFEDRASPASMPPLHEDDSMPMLIERPDITPPAENTEDEDDVEEYRTPRPFLSRYFLDLTETLQEEEPPAEERFFTPLLRAESSMSTDSGASSLTLGNAWDDQEATTACVVVPEQEEGSQAGPSREWGGRASSQQEEMQAEPMEQAWGGDVDENTAAGGAEPDAAAGREASGNEALNWEREDARGGEQEQAGRTDVSPICKQNWYRAFMVVHLPQLLVLDNKRITAAEREQAHSTYCEHFEPHPNGAPHPERLLSAFHRRELGTCGHSPAARRALGGAAVGGSVWPAMSALSSLATPLAESARRYRPRQFEYSPKVPGLMVLGSLSGEVVVLNHETESLVGAVQTIGAPHSILGLSWLNTHPAKLIAGCDNGSIQLLDVDKMRASLLLAARRNPRPSAPLSANSVVARYASGWMGGSLPDAASQTFANFDQLTSVHVNCTDQVFLASGYSSHIGLYDIGTGKRLQVFQDLHREHINVLKFAHHNPALFVTSSFDKDIKMWDLRMPALHPLYTTQSSKGNVMCCFSPDDHYILSSAVDNEVQQHLAVDGRLHTAFDLAPTGSTHNYTRSYYMNGRDYIITGSCEENVVRVCCARTGRRLRDVTLEGRAIKGSLYVQSLRGDPFRDFHFSVLAAYNTPNARSEIVKVNLLSKGEAKTGRIQTEIDDDVPLGA